MKNMRNAFSILLLVCVVSGMLVAEKKRDSLEKMQLLVGQWRGAGQIKRGSTVGGWIESSSWQWEFDKEAALVFETDKGKYFKSGKLIAGEEPGTYALVTTSPDGKSQRFDGKIDDQGKLTLVAETAEKGQPARVHFRFVASGKRLIMLIEQRAGKSLYTRLGEVGFTRKGSGFGQGQATVLCVVTEGAGTIPVTYKGKTYFVCCTGCKDYFNEDPEQALAEYAERLKNKKSKKKQSP